MNPADREMELLGEAHSLSSAKEHFKQGERAGWSDARCSTREDSMTDTTTGAIFSADRVYRYALWRRWSFFGDRRLVFVGLNPGTADENVDDPTIRR